MKNEDRAYLDSVADKINSVVERGKKIMTEIPNMVKEAQREKIDDASVESSILDEKIQQRRYGTIQAAEMAGISHSLLYAAEQDGRLPPPEYRKNTKKPVRAGYTINQINHIRRVFGTDPKKPENSLAAIVGVLNLKGGSQKTTTCQLFSQYLAIQGYRVLLVDTDPQGSLSFSFGKTPDHAVNYEHTIAPYLLEDDESLIEVGFDEGASENLRYAIQETYWDNIDIIPACLQNLNIDLVMKNLIDASDLPWVNHIMKLRAGLQGIAEDYDFIIIDGTPSLNISTLNVVSACDMVFVPAPSAMLDFASTLQFTSLILETIQQYTENGIYPNIPDIRYFITKFSGSSYAQFMGNVIRRVFNVERGDVLSSECHSSDEIGKANNSTYSIYEKNPVEADNRKRLKSTIEMFDKLFKEMHDEIWETCFEDRTGAGSLSDLDPINIANKSSIKKQEEL